MGGDDDDDEAGDDEDEDDDAVVVMSKTVMDDSSKNISVEALECVVVVDWSPTSPDSALKTSVVSSEVK